MLQQLRSLLAIVLLFLTTATSACAQDKPKRMVPGPSVKELVPESSNEEEDGISKIIIGQLFKPGNGEYTRIGAAGLKDAPPLPTGYVLFKESVFRVKTEAVIASSQRIVFSVPSAEDETEFSKLTVLHLEDDEMNPAGHSWAEVTILPGGWNEHLHFVPKAQYDALQPDFKSKRIAAITGQFGIFAIALAPESGPASTRPFTQIEVIPSSTPEPVGVGEEVTHTIVVKNNGPRVAAEVNVKTELNPDFSDVSGTSSQGTCKKSKWTNGRVLCYLGAMQPGTSATITVVGRVRTNVTLTKNPDETVNDLEILFKANATDFATGENQVIMQFKTKILKK